MKSYSVTPSSSKSNMTEDRSDTQSSYFPGCRKDANCNCEICLASINATLDLMPMSYQKSSLSKFSESSSSKPTFVERTPIPFKPSLLSTPRKSISPISASPYLKSSARSNLLEEKGVEMKRKKRDWSIGFGFWRILVGLCVVFAVDSAVSWMVSRVLQPKLSPEIVKRIGEGSWVGDDLNGKFGFLQKELEEALKEKVLNCSSVDANWELKKDGFLRNSRCTVYKSIAEEVSIWGWPLQNEGLLIGGFSYKSLTVLSGRVTEWQNGGVGFSVREANSSWTLERLSASAVLMDRNTWFLEYSQNPMIENSRISLAVMEVLKFCASRAVEKLKSKFVVLLGVVQQYNNYGEHILLRPT
ncbi:hypothetical protein ACHQM5_027496 [Ranunculus cassubicifolius]